jgi:hypothetical protein
VPVFRENIPAQEAVLNHYIRLAVMTVLMFVAMFALMYAMVD